MIEDIRIKRWSQNRESFFNKYYEIFQSQKPIKAK